ncbi:MAG: class II aldolase/adducin family protein [Pseudomonadota bacterium]
MAGLRHITQRRAVIAAALQMNERGINQGTSGNVSLRVAGGCLITPSGIAYEEMTPAQIVLLDKDGGYDGQWRPSSEWRMHHDLYAARSDAGAVVHSHSTYATALSCLRRDIPAFHYMIAVAGGDSLRCADYATFGTQELSDHMLSALEGRSACLLANHGMICFAESLERALWLAMEIETLCKQYTFACLAGQPVILDRAEMEDVLERFRDYGKQESRS